MSVLYKALLIYAGYVINTNNKLFYRAVKSCNSLVSKPQCVVLAFIYMSKLSSTNIHVEITLKC